MPKIGPTAGEQAIGIPTVRLASCTLANSGRDMRVKKTGRVLASPFSVVGVGRWHVWPEPNGKWLVGPGALGQTSGEGTEFQPASVTEPEPCPFRAHLTHDTDGIDDTWHSAQSAGNSRFTMLSVLARPPNAGPARGMSGSIVPKSVTAKSASTNPACLHDARGPSRQPPRD